MDDDMKRIRDWADSERACNTLLRFFGMPCYTELAVEHVDALVCEVERLRVLLADTPAIVEGGR